MVGGGIAGLAAATGLAERGVRVTLVEAQPQLGGRVRAWPVHLTDGSKATMSRGFHAFFRQYYTLRALLRRADPALRHLVPAGDYPLLAGDGTRDSFTNIPRTPPWSVLGFVLASPSFTARELARVNVPAALELLRVRFPRTFSDYDGVSAADFLDRLRFPARARHLSLEVFARSFFADPHDFSAGELVAMFHTYFMGSAEGLPFDVPDDDYDTALWAPLGGYLRGLGVDLRTGTTVSSLEPDPDGSGRLRVRGERLDVSCDAVVLATDRPAMQRLVAQAEWLGSGTRWREGVASGAMAPAFAVWRGWFDRPVAAGSPAFLATSGRGPLDNVSVLERFEAGAAAWARRTGGSVVELHAYALPEETRTEELVSALLAELYAIHPELRDARIVDHRLLVQDDCPLVGVDPWADRPGVDTPDERVVLAGDGVRCPLPVALMERAAVTGFQAANSLLTRHGLPGHDLWTVPMHGLLAR